MSEAWLNFGIALFVQLLFFFVHAYYEKELPKVAHVLGRGLLSGIVLGLLFDLVLGRYVSLWSYTLGKDMLFTILNAALVYGLFASNTLLMRRAPFWSFLVWTLLMGAVLDITNLFFRVWTWKFPFLSLEFLFIFLVGNVGTAILIAGVWHFFLRRRFTFIDGLLKKQLF